MPDARTFTAKQGQYLAFIYYYTKIHGMPPAEADFRRFFRVTPPVAHEMIKTLHARGFIEREPGQARSIRLGDGPVCRDIAGIVLGDVAAGRTEVDRPVRSRPRVRC